MTRTAPRRPEVGVLERHVGSKEEVKPEQGIRVGWLACAACWNTVGAESRTGNRILVNASGYSRMARSVVLEENEVVRIVDVALEVTDLLEAGPAILK